MIKKHIGNNNSTGKLSHPKKQQHHFRTTLATEIGLPKMMDPFEKNISFHAQEETRIFSGL